MTLSLAGLYTEGNFFKFWGIFLTFWNFLSTGLALLAQYEYEFSVSKMSEV